MKAPARLFKLSDWYGDDLDAIGKKPHDNDPWVSPWAKAHYKLRQQEIEIEQCEFFLKAAIEAEDYAEADGLKQRVERLRSQHPITPREERIAEALEEGNYALAATFQRDLDAVKHNLGLPKYNIGQAVVHQYREGIRGIVIDVDLHCSKGRNWVHAAGCLERGCALDIPADETLVEELKGWVAQPFYTVIPDLTDMVDEEAVASGTSTWRWQWPAELSSWEVNHFSELPAPLYLPEDALSHDPEDEKPPSHPEIERLFDGYDASPHRGRIYRPAPRLRLWQQQRQKEQQDARGRQQRFDLSSKNPYDRMQ